MTPPVTPPVTPADSSSAPAKPRRRVWVVALPLVLFLALAALFLVRLEGGGDRSQVPSALVGRAAPEALFPPLEGLTRDGLARTRLRLTPGHGTRAG